MVTTSSPDRATARIAVLGAGLIGCYVGGRLAHGGADVTLIGRAGVMEPIRQRGLRLTDLRGVDLHVPPGRVRATEDAAALAGADLILVTVKSMATGDAAREIERYAPTALVLALQNGVSNAATLAAALPRAIVAAGMVPFNVASPGPAHVHQGVGGDIHAALEPEIEAWAPAFAAAGLPLTLVPDMQAVLWGKLVLNLNNAINALSGLALAQELGTRDYRRALALCQRETLAILKRAGIEPADVLGTPVRMLPLLMSLPTWLYRRLMKARGIRIDRHARSSMAEDLAAGRATEIDYLNGAVVALAHGHGRTAPVNGRVVDLIHAAERGAQPWKARPLLTALEAAGKAKGMKVARRRGV